MAKRKRKTRSTRRSSPAKKQIIDELAKIEDLIANNDLDIDSIMSGEIPPPSDTSVDSSSIVDAILSPDESSIDTDAIPVLDDLVMIPDETTSPLVSASESVLDDPSMIMRVEPETAEESLLLPPPTVVTDQVMEIIEDTLQEQLGSELETHVGESLRERIQQAISDWLKPESA